MFDNIGRQFNGTKKTFAVDPRLSFDRKLLWRLIPKIQSLGASRQELLEKNAFKRNWNRLHATFLLFLLDFCSKPI
jgi:hypothetical protein